MIDIKEEKLTKKIEKKNQKIPHNEILSVLELKKPAKIILTSVVLSKQTQKKNLARTTTALCRRAIPK